MVPRIGVPIRPEPDEVERDVADEPAGYLVRLFGVETMPGLGFLAWPKVRDQGIIQP